MFRRLAKAWAAIPYRGPLTALALLLFAGVALAAFLPPQHQPQYYSYSSANSPAVSKAAPPETFWQRTFHDPVAFYTFVLSIFTAILAISTILLWGSTRNSVRIAERALTELERPVVFPSKFVLKRPYEGGPLTVFLDLTNFGRLLAIVDMALFSITATEKGDRSKSIYTAANDFAHGTMLGPDRSFTDLSFEPQEPFEEILKRAEAKEIDLVCWMQLSYSDPIKRPFTAHIDFKLNPKTLEISVLKWTSNDLSPFIKQMDRFLGRMERYTAAEVKRAKTQADKKPENNS